MTALARAMLDLLIAGVWQGALIATVATAIVALAGRRIGAATRCAIFQLALLAIVLVPIGMLPRVLGGRVAVGGFGTNAHAGAVAAAGADFGPWIHGWSIVIDDRVVLALTTLYAIGVLLLALRLVAGAMQLSRLRMRSERIAERDGVPLYASRDLAVPLAFGLRKPAIVVPAALVHRGDDALECIVLHELAHVRRADAWMHIFERTIHALLYANPAVAFVLRRISLERESACDDWAVAASHDVDVYTRTLASFAVRAGDARAVGFASATVARIHRLEDARRNGATRVSRFTLGGCLIMLGLFALTVATVDPAIALEAPSSHAAAPVVVAVTCNSAAKYLSGPPPDTTGAGPNLVTTLNVRVSAAGKVTSATVRSSSGNARFDRAVIASAEAGTFAPATLNCRPVRGSYVFKAQTGPN